MSQNILNENRVLKLNSQWQPIEVIPVQEAFIAMSRLRQKHYTAKMKVPYNALHIEFPIIDGEVDFSNIITLLPVQWKDWYDLPVRFYDKFLGTPVKLVRVPTVIIAQNHDRIPDFTSGYSKNRVWERDGSTCLLTGEKVNKRTGNIEHRIPLAKGGKTEYKNVYIVKKDINQEKRDLMPEEFYKKKGYKDPIDRLTVPSFKKVIIQNPYNIPDWKHFLPNAS